MVRLLLASILTVFSTTLVASVPPPPDAALFDGSQGWESLVGTDPRSDKFIRAGVRWFAERAALDKCHAAGFAQCVIVESSVVGGCRSQCSGKATAQGIH